MLNRYKVRIIKQWDFEIDAKNQKEAEKQAFFILNNTKILDLPEVKKKLVIKTKRVKGDKEIYEEGY